MGDSKLLNLSCPNCAGNLSVGPSQDLLACGFCGANVQVERSGGTVSLTKITDAMARLQRGTDKTAAELALPRLKEELRVAEGRLSAFRNHKDGLAGSYEARIRLAGKRNSSEGIVIVGFAVIAFAVTYVAVGVPYMLLHAGYDPIPKVYLAIMGLAGVVVAVLLAIKSVRVRSASRRSRVLALEAERDMAVTRQTGSGADLDAQVAKPRARLAENRATLDS